mgnify:CR=1 FL=1
MLGNENDIVHSGLISGAHPAVGVNGSGAVAFDRQRAIGPLRVVKGVDAKMNKHPELAPDLRQLARRGHQTGLLLNGVFAERIRFHRIPPWHFWHFFEIKKPTTLYKGLSVFCGRGDGIRTRDLCVPNAALYQTEPRLDLFARAVSLTERYLLYQTIFHLSSKNSKLKHIFYFFFIARQMGAFVRRKPFLPFHRAERPRNDFGAHSRRRA